jgi:hypothetical protein
MTHMVNAYNSCVTRLSKYVHSPHFPPVDSVVASSAPTPYACPASAQRRTRSRLTLLEPPPLRRRRILALGVHATLAGHAQRARRAGKTDRRVKAPRCARALCMASMAAETRSRERRMWAKDSWRAAHVAPRKSAWR